MGVRQVVGRVLVVTALVASLAAPVAAATPAAAEPGVRVPGGFSESPPRCSTESPPATAPDPTPAVDPDTISVGSYNVLFASGTSNASLDARVPLIVDSIHESGADVVGIQEDELIGSRGHTSERIARALATATGDAWSWCFFMANPIIPGTPDTYVGGGNPESDGLMVANPLGETVWRTGIGLVSRYPIVEAGAHRLPRRVAEEATACGDDFLCGATARVESRAALRALVDAPGGPVQVVSTHLAHNLTSASEQTRLVQSEALVQWIDDFSAGSGVPVVLTGDFNSSPGTAAHATVVDSGFVDTFAAAEPTEPGFTSSQSVTASASTVRSRIDYVFARAGACESPLGAGAGVINSTVIGDAPDIDEGLFLWPSDHYGVVSGLRPFPDDPASCPVTYTARFSEQMCATLERIAEVVGTSAAEVLNLGVSILRQLAAGDAVPPTASLPPNQGPCTVLVAAPPSDEAGIAEAAEAWGADADQLHSAGGRLVLAIIYALAGGGSR